MTSSGWGAKIRVVKDICRRTEDLVVGAVYCKDCLRYKLKENRCEDFVEGNFVITGSYVTKNGVTKWNWEPKRTVTTGES